MASIQTGVELNDKFSSVMMGIINSVNLAVSSMESMNQAMQSDVDTASIQAAREQINQATIAANELSQAFEDMATPEPTMPQAPTVPTPEPIPQPISWQTDNMAVMDGSGMERFRQEVESTEAMLNSLNEQQMQINVTAQGMDILPPEAVRDINGLRDRIQSITLKIQQMESNPISMGTDAANAELEDLRGQLNQAIGQQEELNQAMQSMDVSAINTSYMRLSQTISNTERHIRDNETGQDNFNQAIMEGNNQASNLMGTIKRAVAAYATIESVKGAINISDELMQTTSRLNMMNDGAQDTKDLMNMVYVAAQDARGEFGDMADVVARFGNNAKDAFSSSAEVVQFANLIQKQMTIAGASTQEASNAMLQLSQALGSGVLRGDELNSIFEQSPNLIRGIADYIEKNDALLNSMAKGIGMKSEELSGNVMGHIRDIASEGLISADIVKAAVFSSTNEINENFNSMPMTWGQIWTSMQNTALMAFQPILERLNEIANSDGFQTFVNTAINDLAVLAGVALDIFNFIGEIASFISDNWSVISPIVYGVIAAFTAYYGIMGIVKLVSLIAAAAQWVYNAALMACPLTWIMIAIAAVIGLLVVLANKFSGAGHTAKTAFGAICGGVMVVITFFKNMGLAVANVFLAIGNALAALGSNIITAFKNAIKSVQAFWYDLLSTVMSVVEKVCEILNKIPFVEFDYSGVTNAADDYAAKAADARNSKEDYKSVSDAFYEGGTTFEYASYSDAYKAGAKWGDGVTSKVKGAFSSKAVNIPKASDYSNALANSNNHAAVTAANTGQTASNTAKTAKSLSATSEDLKYIRDMAEQKYINKFTTARITVHQTNHNNINKDMDLDGVTEHLRTTMEQQMYASAEGVH